jgi:hypothetical protein
MSTSRSLRLPLPQRLSGAPFACLVGFPKEGFAIVEGKDSVQGFHSSPNMCRYRCAKCGSPVYNESLDVEHPFIDVPLVAFERDELGLIKHLDVLQPKVHINYEMHVTGLVDSHTKGVKKFSKMPGSASVE